MCRKGIDDISTYNSYRSKVKDIAKSEKEGLTLFACESSVTSELPF